MEADCVFCKISSGEESAEKIKETEHFFVIRDKYPSAPIHFLIIPKEHYNDITEIDADMWEEIRRLAIGLKNEQHLKGFRLATNVGEAAFINHLHVHFLSGITKDRSV